ncbi:MAG: CarD family transcriptional regulator [Oscillospiraceae bacterium]|nr:CarD family transcriptional regulator [Oscillospiraceae bacterium]
MGESRFITTEVNKKMYKVGDLLFYGSTGTCRVVDITSRDPAGAEKPQKYYVLSPLYQNYTIYVPVNTTKIPMRPIISKEEAHRLIDLIPSIRVEIFHSRIINELTQHYKASLDTHECTDLLKLCMSIYAKKQAVEQQKRKFGAIDERFMNRAEDLLFGELAAALDIEREQVTGYITNRLNKKRNGINYEYSQ